MGILYIISRDGKAIDDFMLLHNLDKKDVKIVKLASDLSNADGGRYVIVSPLPLAYQWAIRPLFRKKGMVNVTKFYHDRENTL